jgi:hypothetical protein
MITREHIETVLGAALANLGHPLSNATLWKEHIKGKLTEEEVYNECERIKKEIGGVSTTWDSVRAKRNALLKESDWAIIPDATPKPSKEAWLNYRQALRDLPQTFSSPEEVVWPDKPE